MGIVCTRVTQINAPIRVKPCERPDIHHCETASREEGVTTSFEDIRKIYRFDSKIIGKDTLNSYY